MNPAVNLQVAYEVEQVLTSLMSISFSRRPFLCGLGYVFRLY